MKKLEPIQYSNPLRNIFTINTYEITIKTLKKK